MQDKFMAAEPETYRHTRIPFFLNVLFMVISAVLIGYVYFNESLLGRFYGFNPELIRYYLMMTLTFTFLYMGTYPFVIYENKRKQDIVTISLLGAAAMIFVITSLATNYATITEFGTENEILFGADEYLRLLVGIVFPMSALALAYREGNRIDLGVMHFVFIHGIMHLWIVVMEAAFYQVSLRHLNYANLFWPGSVLSPGIPDYYMFFIGLGDPDNIWPVKIWSQVLFLPIFTAGPSAWVFSASTWVLNSLIIFIMFSPAAYLYILHRHKTIDLKAVPGVIHAFFANIVEGWRKFVKEGEEFELKEIGTELIKENSWLKRLEKRYITLISTLVLLFGTSVLIITYYLERTNTEYFLLFIFITIIALLGGFFGAWYGKRSNRLNAEESNLVQLTAGIATFEIPVYVLLSVTDVSIEDYFTLRLLILLPPLFVLIIGSWIIGKRYMKMRIFLAILWVFGAAIIASILIEEAYTAYFFEFGRDTVIEDPELLTQAAFLIIFLGFAAGVGIVTHNYRLSLLFVSVSISAVLLSPLFLEIIRLYALGSSWRGIFEYDVSYEKRSIFFAIKHTIKNIDYVISMELYYFYRLVASILALIVTLSLFSYWGGRISIKEGTKRVRNLFFRRGRGRQKE